MKSSIYKTLVPESLREKLYDADVRHYQAEQYNQRLNIEKAHPRSELSPVYIANLRVLVNRNALLKELPTRATVAEICAGAGEFSNNILLITDPKQLCLMDSWPEHTSSDKAMGVVAGKYKKEIEDGQLLLDNGEPLSMLADYDDGYFDWVYINSEPSYKSTMSMLELCRMKVNSDGIIVGNNYTTGNYIDLARYGVIEAVNEYCKKHRWEMIYLTHESHRRLSYALKCISS